MRRSTLLGNCFSLLLILSQSTIHKSPFATQFTKNKVALKAFRDELGRNGVRMTDQQFLKKIINMKSRTKERADMNRTGNKPTKLLPYMSVINDIINGDENPSFNKVPGSTSAGYRGLLPPLSESRVRGSVRLSRA